MIFSIQRYLEDYFDRKNLSDVDQYAVKLAHFYVRRRKAEPEAEFLKGMHRLQTAFYRNNAGLARPSVEREILRRLDAKFQKKNSEAADLEFPGGVAIERAKLRRLPKRSIAAILRSFKHATEARGIDTIWVSRKQGKLRPRPEKVAQGMLSQFVMGVLSNRGGQLLRELASGVGFVDVVVRLGTVEHLVEIKILRSAFTGAAQLEAYMSAEQRTVGWLVVFDARKPARKSTLSERLNRPAGAVHVVCIDVNPIPPSRKK